MAIELKGVFENVIKTRILTGMAVGAAFLLASIAANAQIVGSAHDLSPDTTGTDQVCVFCHTPHGAATGASAAGVPLWNKTLPNPATYTRYSTLNTATLDGAETEVGSVSLACLSCHDGTQARDVLINSPGSGMTGTALGVGPLTGTPVPVLGTDLTDDHPVSIQYAGGGYLITDPDGVGTNTGLLGDPDFAAATKGLVNAQPNWWVDSPVGAGTQREKVDMLLYARSDPALDGGALQPFVECGSCHDPHNASTSGAGSVAFLRIQNTASQICTTCHTK